MISKGKLQDAPGKITGDMIFKQDRGLSKEAFQLIPRKGHCSLR